MMIFKGFCTTLLFCIWINGFSQTGACCTPAGNCVSPTTLGACNAIGGTFFLGRDCNTSNPCGACCTPAGNCVGQTTITACDAIGGTFLPGGGCDPDPCPLLPVKLISFIGSYNPSKNTIDLSWKTAQEYNSKLFSIERSTDEGTTFVEIGHLNAAGYSSIIKQYYFTDTKPQEGFNLYRLKQIDLDTRFEYSKIVFVKVKKDDQIYYSIYPNPAKVFAYISTNTSKNTFVTIQLLDGTGRILKQQTGNLSNSSPVNFDLVAIKSGLYFLRIITAESQKTSRLMIQ